MRYWADRAKSSANPRRPSCWHCSGISIVGSTPIGACDNLRIARHKVFAGLAARGKSSTGRFFGFKLYVIFNHQGEILAIGLTPGNVDDRKPVAGLCQSLFGKLFGDKGYLARCLSEMLAERHVHLVTKVRKNIKPLELTHFDQALLRQRSLIKTVTVFAEKPIWRSTPDSLPGQTSRARCAARADVDPARNPARVVLWPTKKTSGSSTYAGHPRS